MKKETGAMLFREVVLYYMQNLCYDSIYEPVQQTPWEERPAWRWAHDTLKHDVNIDDLPMPLINGSSHYAKKATQSATGD